MAEAKSFTDKLVADAARTMALQDGRPLTDRDIRNYLVDARAVVITVIEGLIGRRKGPVTLSAPGVGDRDLRALLGELEGLRSD